MSTHATPARPTDWSLVTTASNEALAGPLAGIAMLGQARRATLACTIGREVVAFLKKELSPWFSPGLRDHAEVDVIAATPVAPDGVLDGGQPVVIHFVADHLNRIVPQSGSDEIDHYFYVGEAELDGDTLRRVTFALERQVGLSEHEGEHYDPGLVRELFRIEQRDRLAGSALDRTRFDAAVSAVREASTAQAAAVQAAAEARRPPSRSPALCCPACGAAEVTREPQIESWMLACRACGHRETFMLGPDGDDDGHWWFG